MAKISIGWVAVRRAEPGKWQKKFAGHKARCKVYASRGVAIAATKSLMPYRGYDKPYSEAEVLAEWDICEAFIETT